MILDATKRAEQRALLEAELDAVGIRLNKEPPYVPDQLNLCMKLKTNNVSAISISKLRRPVA
jgi:ribosome-interacting GTPase 1